jgi:hypothetical protein
MNGGFMGIKKALIIFSYYFSKKAGYGKINVQRSKR